MQSQCHLLTVTKLIENESDSLKNVGKSTSNDHENINESVKLKQTDINFTLKYNGIHFLAKAFNSEFHG